jgi:hypothetical protein
MIRIIHFDWEGVTYTVPEGRNPILLPGGQVLNGDSWQQEIFPRRPGKLSLNYSIVITPKTDLVSLARSIGAVLAKAITISLAKKCPHGCSEPTTPYCSKCGSVVEIVEVVLDYIPTKPLPFQHGAAQNVQGNGPCPSCGIALDHNHQLSTCQNCGQSLHWTCRDGHSPTRSDNWANRNPI